MGLLSRIKAADAFVKMTLETAGVFGQLRKFEKDLSGRLRKIGRNVAALSKQFAILGASLTAPLTAFTLEAAKAEVSALRFERTFKGLAGQAENFAMQMADLSGFNFRDMRSGLVRLQAFFKSMGFEAEEAFEQSRKMLAVATDLASVVPDINGLSDAINRIVSGLRGEEALEEFANTKAVALAAQLAKEFGTNIKTATELQKVLARSKLIDEGVLAGGITGGAEATLPATSGVIRKAASDFKDLRIALGEIGAAILKEVGPAFSAFVKGLAAFVKRNPQIVRRIAQLATAVSGLAIVLGGLVVTFTILAAAINNAGLIAAGIAFGMIALGWRSIQDALDDVSELANRAAKEFELLGKAMQLENANQQLAFLSRQLDRIFATVALTFKHNLLSAMLDAFDTFANTVNRLPNELGGIPIPKVPVLQDNPLLNKEFRQQMLDMQIRALDAQGDVDLDRLNAILDAEAQDRRRAAEEIEKAGREIGVAAGKFEQAAALTESAAIGTAKAIELMAEGGVNTVEDRQLDELKEINRQIKKQGQNQPVGAALPPAGAVAPL